MFGLGGSEILFILLIALLVIGPKNFPKIARSMARFFAEARRWSFEFSKAMDEAAVNIDLDPKKKAQATVVKASPAPPDQGNQDTASPNAGSLPYDLSETDESNVKVTQDRPGPPPLDEIEPPEENDDKEENPS
jgi:sec-independent protein translocase protein TatB